IGSGCGESGPVTVVCWFHVIERPGLFSKTVRAPRGPRLKLGIGAGASLICSRIFSEVAVMLCVVKRLAPAMSAGFAPPANADGRASSRALRYVGAEPGYRNAL